ncbi:MAG: glycosyltransferase, partial [Lachnospiraceae bacterium]|nr:glycosyltransferase [Lachnospiraceae bacterium]
AEVYLHILYTRLTDRHGLASRRATRAFLKWADEYDPDILWLHNIHGYYINYELLFNWIKKRPQMQVKWTLHDCWTFTGHCGFYLYCGCDKWKISDGPMSCRCSDCPQPKAYPATRLFSNSAKNYERKRRAFTGVKNLTIITPSKWLADELSHSFLKDYPVEVIYNTVNTEIFKPTPSSFKADHGISDDDKMILGVANIWEPRKGLEDFIRLEQILKSESEARGTSTETTKSGKIKIVLVGLTPAQIDDLQKRAPGIIALGRTKDVYELAKVYSAADVFLNPTYEDNLPTVNLEAEACGTPVIAYDTGGCAETLHRPDSRVIPQDISLVPGTITKLLQP